MLIQAAKCEKFTQRLYNSYVLDLPISRRVVQLYRCCSINQSINQSTLFNEGNTGQYFN